MILPLRQDLAWQRSVPKPPRKFLVDPSQEAALAESGGQHVGSQDGPRRAVRQPGRLAAACHSQGLLRASGRRPASERREQFTPAPRPTKLLAPSAASSPPRAHPHARRCSACAHRPVLVVCAPWPCSCRPPAAARIVPVSALGARALHSGRRNFDRRPPPEPRAPRRASAASPASVRPP